MTFEPVISRKVAKYLARALLLLLFWAAVVLILSLEGCSRGYTEKTQLTPAWAAAWACRCDSCCQELDDLEAERLDQLEGAQL